jgi:hypothetical protein
MSILAPPSAPREVVMGNLERLGAAELLTDGIAPLAWDIAVDHHMDPAGVLALIIQESNWGRFTGRVPWWFRNPSGLKVRNDQDVMDLLDTDDANHPLVHSQWGTWELGILATVQHVLAYCDVTPPGELIIDPRWDWVIGRFQITKWSEFGHGVWSGGDKGAALVDLMGRISAAT